jgi:hypothetical protein
MSPSKDKRKAPLDLVGAEAERGESSQASLDALRAALNPSELPGADHEALLALTLGDEVAEIEQDDAAAGDALRHALEGRASHPQARQLAELAEALRWAYRADHAPLSTFDHELLVALSVGDEAADLERDDDALGLARAMEGEGDHPLAELATAVGLAAGQGRDLDQLTHERMVRKVLATPLAARTRTPSRGAVFAAIVALAAGIALFFGSMQWIETQGGGTARRPAPALTTPLVEARSTQELFDPATPFPTKGGESERLDKIVAARSADLRANRFAAWGVPATEQEGMP